MAEFRVELETFRGPLDLLLYLVRKHEVEITDIPIAPITEQYLQYLEVIQALDVNAVGDFLDLASTLTEIKSRLVLPRGGELEEEIEDPRRDLVWKLLEYKQFRDASSVLDQRSHNWQQRYARLASDLDDGPRNLAEQPIKEVEIWDLVSAFGRILRSAQASQTASITYDDTPIHVHMARIRGLVLERGRLLFSELFQPGLHKSRLVGLFLAVLELVRHHGVRAEQEDLFGDIVILPGEAVEQAAESAAITNYEHGSGHEDVPITDAAASAAAGLDATAAAAAGTISAISPPNAQSSVPPPAEVTTPKPREPVKPKRRPRRRS